MAGVRPSALEGIGADRLADAMAQCARPCFGEPKRTQLVYADGRVVDIGMPTGTRWLREMIAQGGELPVRVERFWTDTDQWEDSDVLNEMLRRAK